MSFDYCMASLSGFSMNTWKENTARGEVEHGVRTASSTQFYTQTTFWPDVGRLVRGNTVVYKCGFSTVLTTDF